MKQHILKLAVLGTFGLAATQAFGLGFESLPVAGFAVTGTGAGTHQPAGGTTAYKICNSTGNYGASSTGSVAPTTSANNTCAILPNPASINVSPESGFNLIASSNHSIIMNNGFTNNTNINIGTLVDSVFRNPANTECIYATRVSLTNVDYDLTQAGSQTFLAAGIARGGFANSGTVSVGYAQIGNYADVVFRAGRTFTSVQHRPKMDGSHVYAAGYYNLPLTTPTYNLSINGLNSSGGVPSASQQSASINANWVEFTTNAYSIRGISVRPASPTVYVKAACTSSAPVAVNDAIRLRQTEGYGNFIEISVQGYVPPGGNALPAPINPY